MPKTLRIVFADDHPIFRAGLRQILASDRSIAVLAELADGPGALEAILTQKPDVAVLDFDLPGMNGLEITQALQRRRAETPIVILTAHRDTTLFESAISAGVRGYLLKDHAANDLPQCLQAVAAGDTHFSPTFSKYLLERARRADSLREEVRGLDALSPAERRVLRLIAMNKTSREIAQELFLSPATVETHRKNICTKLELRGPNKLLQFAIENRAGLG